MLKIMLAYCINAYDQEEPGCETPWVNMNDAG